MADVRPFRALRPRNELAGDVIAPPYDVLSEPEARGLALNRKSFVRITRSEVDLPEGSDSHGELAYAKARENLDGFVSGGVMQRDDEPTYYFYGQKMGDHHQVGVLAACSVEEYDQGRIAKHEYTRPDKPAFSEELKGMFISAGFLLLILFLHPYFAGVTPFPR